MSETSTRGLYHKFDVRRTDGSSENGGKHDGCTYFVLDLEHDAHAPAALRAYARSCSESHPQLSRDLIAVADGNKLVAQKPALPNFIGGKSAGVSSPQEPPDPLVWLINRGIWFSDPYGPIDQVKFEKLRADWLAASRLRAPQEPAQGKMRSVLEKVLRSAVPNPKEHPTMFKAWCEARSYLALLDSPDTEAQEPAQEKDIVSVYSGCAIQKHERRCPACGEWCSIYANHVCDSRAQEPAQELDTMKHGVKP